MAKPKVKKKLIASYRRGKIDPKVPVRAFPDPDRPGRWCVAQGQKLVGTSKAFALKEVKFIATDEDIYFLEGLVVDDVYGVDPRKDRLRTMVIPPLRAGAPFMANPDWVVKAADAVIINRHGITVTYFYGDRRWAEPEQLS